MTDIIPGADLPLGTPGASDTVIGVDQANGTLRRFRRDSFPLSPVDQARINALELGQSADMLGFATKALMDDDLAHSAGTLAVVTNDGTATNNGTWRKTGSSGTGNWVQAADRLSSLEQSVATLMPLEGGLRQDVPGSDPYFAIADEAGFAIFAAHQDGSFGTPSVTAGVDAISNDAFAIGQSPIGVRFQVVDEAGFAAVYAGDSEIISDTSSIEAEIANLQASVVLAGSASGIPTPLVRIGAHRGTTIGGVAPEDSLDSYIMAARAGYALVETDVQVTSDGEFVIIHDTTMNRTFRNKVDYSAIGGTVNVVDNTLATLRANYVLAADNPAHRRPIPTFREFCRTCRDFGVHPVIEPKVGFTLAQHTALVAIANDILGIGGYSFTSFSMTALDELRTLTSHATLYYIVTPTDANIDHVATKMPAVVYPTYTDVTQHVVQYAHSKGVKVAAWTIPTSQFDIMRKLGLDEFITDTIGPELNWQAVIYRGYSDGVYAGYTTSGVIGSDGIVTLDSGEQINFSPRPELATPLGAHYISIDLQGACTINSNNLAVSVNNTADDFATYAYQCMVKGVTPVLTITAGAGGCRVKDIRLAVAKF